MFRLLRSRFCLIFALTVLLVVSPSALAQDTETPTGTISVFSVNCSTPTGTLREVIVDAIEGCVPAGGSVLTVYQYGDNSGAPVAGLTTDAQGSAAVNLPAGDYQIVAEDSQLTVDVTVVNGNTVYVFHEIASSEEPESTTGTVSVSSQSCGPNVADIRLGPADPREGCSRISSTLSLYLYGDNSGAPVASVVTDASGNGQVDVAAGTYAIVDDNTGLQMDIEVTAGGTTSVTSIVPSEPQAPPAGPTTGAPAPTEAPAQPTQIPAQPTQVPAQPSTSSSAVSALPSTGSSPAAPKGSSLGILMGVGSVAAIALAVIGPLRRIALRP